MPERIEQTKVGDSLIGNTQAFEGLSQTNDEVLYEHKTTNKIIRKEDKVYIYMYIYVYLSDIFMYFMNIYSYTVIYRIE